MIKLLCVDAKRSDLEEGTIYTQWGLMLSCCSSNETWVQLEERPATWRAGRCRFCGFVLRPVRTPYRRSRFIQLNDPQADTREELTEEELNEEALVELSLHARNPQS